MFSVIAVLFLLTAGKAAFAASGPGVAGGPLLAQPVGARPLALGAGYVALADDSLAVFWNPAGLVQLRGPEVNLMYQREPGEVTYGYLVYAHPLPAGQSVSAALGTLTTADIEFVDLAGNAASVAGQSDVMAAFSFASSFLPLLARADSRDTSLSGGVTLKYLQSSVGGDFEGRIPTVDLGLLFKTRFGERTPPTRVGLVWQNAGARIKLGQQSDPVASPLRFGLAHTFMEGRHSWTTVNLEAVRILTRENTAFHLGMEQVWKPSTALGVAARGGYRGGTDLPGLSGGVGILWNRFVLDYGIARLSLLGLVHRVGLRVRWVG